MQPPSRSLIFLSLPLSTSLSICGSSPPFGIDLPLAANEKELCFLGLGAVGPLAVELRVFGSGPCDFWDSLLFYFLFLHAGTVSTRVRLTQRASPRPLYVSKSLMFPRCRHNTSRGVAALKIHLRPAMLTPTSYCFPVDL